MFIPRSTYKDDPKKRWAQSDRVFFGFGACHILAGVFLESSPLDQFYAEWISPKHGFRGTHVFVTNGWLAFDYRGYSRRATLLRKYVDHYQKAYPGWNAQIERVTFSLLDTAALNARQHRGPDQYFADPRPRAHRFIASIPVPKMTKAPTDAGALSSFASRDGS